jgi:hypothetical protein
MSVALGADPQVHAGKRGQKNPDLNHQTIALHPPGNLKKMKKFTSARGVLLPLSSWEMVTMMIVRGIHS